MEYEFVFTAYPMTEAQAEALREKLQDVILKAIEADGFYMGPLVVEEVEDEGKAD